MSQSPYHARPPNPKSTDNITSSSPPPYSDSTPFPPLPNPHPVLDEKSSGKDDEEQIKDVPRIIIHPATQDRIETVISSRDATPHPTDKSIANDHPSPTEPKPDTDAVDNTNSSDNHKLQPLPELPFHFRLLPLTLYILFLILCNVVIPCLLFYLLEEFTHLSTKELIGISSAALGVSSCFDAPLRLYRLTRYRKTYGPLGSDKWWHLDFVMWTYTFALLIFAFPLSIAPAIAFYNFFLTSTILLIGPISLPFIFSLILHFFNIPLPIKCSSDPPGVVMKPAMFYVIEDIASVDFMNGRAFRRVLYARYTLSPPFKSLILLLTIYFTLQSLFYCAITAVVTFTTELGFAFGWVLGQLFLWMILCAGGAWGVVRWGLQRERMWWEGR